MTIYEQVDRTSSYPSRYSWILSGVPRNTINGIKQLGWKYIRGVGCSGSYVTNDSKLAQKTAVAFRLTIESNGTHAVTNCSMFQF